MSTAVKHDWTEWHRLECQRSGGEWAAALEQWAYLQPFLTGLLAEVPPRGRVLDVGCGAGWVMAILDRLGYWAEGIDNVREFSMDPLCPKGMITVGDAGNLSKWYRSCDAVLSVGLLEHFTPSSVVDLLQEQALCAPVVGAVVPTAYTKHGIHGVVDERPYTTQKLRRLFEAAHIRPVRWRAFGWPPTRWARLLHWVLPGAVSGMVRKYSLYAMNISVIGRVER